MVKRFNVANLTSKIREKMKVIYTDEPDGTSEKHILFFTFLTENQLLLIHFTDEKSSLVVKIYVYSNVFTNPFFT